MLTHLKECVLQRRQRRIGDSSPSYKLDVNGTGRFVGVLYANTYVNTPAVYGTTVSVGGAAGGSPRLNFSATGITTQGTGDISLLSGNVGIGLTNPSTKFHVYNGEATIASSTDGVKLSYSAGNSSGIIDTAFSDNNLEFRTNGTAKMWIANAGNVGIGVTVPTAKLDVRGTGNFLGTAASGAPLVTIENNSGSTATSYGLLVKGGGNSSSGKTFEVRDDSGNTDLIVKGNGNVGIGTTSPQQKLHIVDTDGANIILNSNTGAENNGIWMTEGGIAAPYANGAYVHYDSTNNAFKINTGTTSLTTKLTIERDSGNVGIGTTSPGIKLDVNSGGSDSVARFTSTDARARILISDNNDISYFGTYIGTTFLGPDDTPSGNTINVLSNGNVGIGTTSIDEKLQVEAGNIKIEGGATSTVRGLIIAHTGWTGNQTLLVQDTTTNRGHLYTTERALRIEAGSGGGTGTGETLDFWVNGSERMMIDTTGNVGIGTTTRP